MAKLGFRVTRENVNSIAELCTFLATCLKAYPLDRFEAFLKKEGFSEWAIEQYADTFDMALCIDDDCDSLDQIRITKKDEERTGWVFCVDSEDVLDLAQAVQVLYDKLCEAKGVDPLDLDCLPETPELSEKERLSFERGVDIAGDILDNREYLVAQEEY